MTETQNSEEKQALDNDMLPNNLKAPAPCTIHCSLYSNRAVPAIAALRPRVTAAGACGRLPPGFCLQLAHGGHLRALVTARASASRRRAPLQRVAPHAVDPREEARQQRRLKRRAHRLLRKPVGARRHGLRPRGVRRQAHKVRVRRGGRALGRVSLPLPRRWRAVPRTNAFGWCAKPP